MDDPNLQGSNGKMTFSDTLDLLMVDPKQVERNSVLQDCVHTSKELEKTRYKLMNLEHKLKTLHHKLNCELAMQFRKEYPNLNINIHRNNCKVGYKSKHLLLKPDFKKQFWSVDSADSAFANRFKRDARAVLLLSTPLTELIAKIAEFFRLAYKSLGEDITDHDGVLIIEGKSANLMQLVQFSRSADVIS